MNTQTATPIAMLDASKFSFKGTSKAILEFKTEVEALQNAVGKVVSMTYGCYDFQANGSTVRVPKSWVIILE